jgi:hypothetical protein
MMGKKWYKSRTLWANVILVTLGVLGAVQGVLDDKLTIIIFVAVSALLNGILRIITDTKLTK